MYHNILMAYHGQNLKAYAYESFDVDLFFGESVCVFGETEFGEHVLNAHTLFLFFLLVRQGTARKARLQCRQAIQATHQTTFALHTRVFLKWTDCLRRLKVIVLFIVAT